MYCLFKEILAIYNGNLNPNRVTVGMKVSFAIGIWIQFVTFLTYIILYRHVTNHNNSMLLVAVISEDTFRVKICFLNSENLEYTIVFFQSENFFYLFNKECSSN